MLQVVLGQERSDVHYQRRHPTPSSQSNGVLASRVWTLGDVGPQLLCPGLLLLPGGGADDPAAINWSIMLEDAALEKPPLAQVEGVAPWQAVVLMLRHAAAFSCMHIRHMATHALGKLALRVGEPLRLSVYQHLVALANQEVPQCTARSLARANCSFLPSFLFCIAAGSRVAQCYIWLSATFYACQCLLGVFTRHTRFDLVVLFGFDLIELACCWCGVGFDED